MAITKATNAGFASNKYNNVSADNYYMEPIAKTLVGVGGASSITFSNIPQNYKHLQVRCLGRTTGAVDNDVALLTFNSDTGTNYSAHDLRGNGGVVAAGGYPSQTSMYLQRFAGGNQTSGMFGVVVADILDYANTSKYKTLRDIGGYDFNGTGNAYLASGLWMNTNAITSMSMTPAQGGVWAQYTRFALYGIRG
jgi:hypothetical protein